MSESKALAPASYDVLLDSRAEPEVILVLLLVLLRRRTSLYRLQEI